MLDAIEYSTKHFFKHIMRSKIETTNKLEKAQYYGASITLSDSEKECNCYLMFRTDTLNFLAEKLDLGLNGEEDKSDLLKEIANQIIGYAKRLLADAYDDYSISVPEFLGKVDEFKLPYTHEFIYKLEGKTFRIAVVVKDKWLTNA